MQRMRTRHPAFLVCCAALLLAGGCVIASDLVNPQFFALLGLDPSTILPGEGSIIVAFVNNSDATARFFAYEAVDLNDARNFSVDVPPNSMRNEVIDCPVTVLTPGMITAEGTPDTTAVQLLDTEQAVAVAYNGSTLLVAGQHFECGDLIEFILDQAGTTYTFSVVVVPGR